MILQTVALIQRVYSYVTEPVGLNNKLHFNY